MCAPRLVFQVPPVKYILCSDVNLDGYVNGKDAVIVGRNYSEVAGTPTWNPRADVNGDGMVDVPDVALVGSAFGSKA